MSKFNSRATRPAVASPVTSERVATGSTFEGAPGFARDAQSELFLLAVTNMVGEQTFYESADDRDSRYTELVHTVAIADPDWTARFLAWLRTGANMRSASLVGGLEAAKAMIAAGIPGGRQIVASVLQRPDEPGEALAYWTATYGRKIPKAVKRGIADAAARLYNERAVLKWDTASKDYRFGDVLNLVHADARGPWQAALYEHVLDRRYGRDEEVPDQLPMIRANRSLRAQADERPDALLDAERLREAGMTWEDALSLAGSKIDKAKLWESLFDGTIDTVGSDHVGRKSSTKQGSIWDASAGFPGMATILPVLISEGYYQRGLPLQRIAELTAYTPSRIFGIGSRKGDIRPGFDADLAVVDLALERKADPIALGTHSDYSLYQDRTLKGWPRYTFLRGELAQENGTLMREPGGGRYVR